jgi:hypothetical protein
MLSVQEAAQILQKTIDSQTLSPQQKQAIVEQNVKNRLTLRNFNILLSQPSCNHNNLRIAPIRYSFMKAAEYGEEPIVGIYLINSLLNIHTKNDVRSKIYAQLTQNAIRSGLVSYLDAILTHPGYPKQNLAAALAHAEVTGATDEIKEYITQQMRDWQ